MLCLLSAAEISLGVDSQWQPFDAVVEEEQIGSYHLHEEIVQFLANQAQKHSKTLKRRLSEGAIHWINISG